MKIIAALTLAVAVNANAQASQPGPDNTQEICANLAAAGVGAALGNNLGYPAEYVKMSWLQMVQTRSNPGLEASFIKMGNLEIDAVYQADVTTKGEGYWIAYDTCVRSMQ